VLVIDGSQGEGGGQVLRASLALSLVTGTPFRIEKIRAGRARPGLMRQHLTAVRAAAEVSSAEVSGDAIGSREVTFRPGPVAPGAYRFAIGSAGSVTLVLETVLPALMLAGAPSMLTLEGGTHNPLAPPFDFLERAFLPLLARMGPKVDIRLERHGFYPAGGGRFTAAIAPVPALRPLTLLERGAARAHTATALVAGLPGAIGVRELDVVAEGMGWDRAALRPRMLEDAHGPGNALVLDLAFEHVTEVVTGFGEKGVAAEAVARAVVAGAQAYLASEAPVGEHLADQLLLPLAISGAGRFRTVPPSLHTRTEIEVIRSFLPVRIEVEEISERMFEIRIEEK